MVKNKKVHMIGICGAGMSALAVIFKESGWQVTGSDENSFEPIPSYLKKNKITFYKTYSHENVPKDVDLVVIGNNIPLNPEENPEKKYALEIGKEIVSMPFALASLSKDKENILVVGSSGKSTNTTLLAWCLLEVKKDPSYFIGALPVDFKNSSHLGGGQEFVIEGDEYPSSKEDKRSKFLHFKPSAVLLTSAMHDHVNIFPTEKSYLEPYKKLVAKIPKNGLLVYARNGKNNTEIVKSAKCKTLSYGLDSENSDWFADNIKYDINSSFDLMHRENGEVKKIIAIKTWMLGRHNIENIVGVGALLLESKKITPEIFKTAINSFHGVSGRIELLSKKTTIPIYLDFGSSYEKAKSMFDTLRLYFANRRIVAVFEPHAFSWRNRKFIKWYQTIFENIEEVIVLPAASYGKKAKDQLTKEEVWEEAKKYSKIHVAESEEKALEILQKTLKAEDVIALVSSGTLLGLKTSAPKLAEKMFPKN